MKTRVIAEKGNEIMATKENSEEKSPKGTNGGKQLPAGYTNQSGEIVGFWNHQETEQDHLHWIPRYAKLMDSSIDSEKTSILIIGELVDDAVLLDQEKNEVEGRKGQLVGVWGKPGMAALKNLAGVPVYMYPDGEKDTGKPNPMQIYFIGARSKGRLLKVTEDYREDSKGQRTFLSVGSTLPDAPF